VHRRQITRISCVTSRDPVMRLMHTDLTEERTRAPGRPAHLEDAEA
jgi:hypothetical protein